MAKIYCTEFDGGIAESNYDRRPNVASDMYHMTATVDPNVLKNHPANQKDTYDGTNENVYCYDAVPRGNGTYIGLGIDRASPPKCKFYRKNNNDLNSYWQVSSVDAAPSTSYTPYTNGAFAYKTYVFGVCYASSGATVSLYRYEGDANTTSFSTISPTTASTTMAKPIVHSQDNIAYLGIGTTISKFDGTTFSGNVLTLPYTIVAIQEYGTYLAILCITSLGKGVVYLWGRDTSVSTLQEIYLAGDDTPKTMLNINGILVVISQGHYVGSGVNYFLDSKITARALIGGKFVVTKSISTTNLITIQNPNINNNWAMWKDVGYFFDASSNCQLYACGWNKQGEFYISKDRWGGFDGETISSTSNFFNLGDYFGFAINGGGVRISYAADPLSRSIDSYWHSIPNPAIAQQAFADLPKIKSVKKVWARFYANSAGYGTVSMKITRDANSQETIFSESAPSGKRLFVIEADSLSTGGEIGSGRDLKFKINTDQGIDLIDYGYEYEIEGSLI